MFLLNHAKAIITCDFLVVVTATFRLVDVFSVIHHGSRRLFHFNVTADPTAAWTLQQLRETIAFDDGYRYLLHDRDCIFSHGLDASIVTLGLQVLKSPPRVPKANAIGRTPDRNNPTRLPGLADPNHMRSILKSWACHYNRCRPHMSLGPGLPDPPSAPTCPAQQKSRHRIDVPLRLNVKLLLGRVHHECALQVAT
jgi:transposase InsO family protein